MYIIMIITVIDQSPLLRLYHTESFTKFIGDVLGLPKLYRLADPLVIDIYDLNQMICMPYLEAQKAQTPLTCQINIHHITV